MSFSGRPAAPATPRIISPSPTPSERQNGSQESYFGPVTRSATKRRQTSNISDSFIDEDLAEDSDPDLRRARTRSRSPIKSRRVAPLTPSKRAGAAKPAVIEEKESHESANGAIVTTQNGHLAPPTPATKSGWSWRDLSRSPSPLGLIPIHRQWRTFVHKHEVPRKVLHTSIGFVVYWLYATGTQPGSVAPFLLAQLVPIAAADYLRHKNESFNRFYVKVLGALMRESEYMGWNGVIFYLLGTWLVLFFLPKDVAVVSIMLLSWCDTAASTFGRLYGRYTPRIRRGKSLAGSLAALIVGITTAAWFWGWAAPRTAVSPGDAQNPFMFQGTLGLPELVTSALGWTRSQATIGGGAALAVLSLWSGFVAAGSEVIDLFGWDDNLTIPVLSGIGLWGFLKLFG